jgi:hypothetical protein
MLCDNCHEREATCFSTKCTQVASGDVISSDTVNLCKECFEAADPATSHEISSAWQAGCRYCGGEPHCSSPDLSAGIQGPLKICALCESCSTEFYRYVNVKIPWLGNPEAMPAPGEMGDVAAALADVEQHMKTWISERDA